MSTQEKQQRLLKLYRLAQLAGLCSNKREFAEFLHVSDNSIYLALNGDERFLSEKFFIKVEKALTNAGVNLNGGDVYQTVANDNANVNNNAQAGGELMELLRNSQTQLSEALRQNSQLLQIITNLTTRQ